MTDLHVTAKHLFPTLFLDTTLPDSHALNVKLRIAILQEKQRSAGVLNSNFLGWQSNDNFLEQGGDAARTLAIAAINTCNPYTAGCTLDDGSPKFAWAVQMWANVSPAGASNQFHAHPGAFWSAVYYVDDGGDQKAGTLVLQDPRFPLNKMTVPDITIQDENGVEEQTEININAVPGKLVAFPSWLTHGVRPHNGPGERISIAMNLMALPVRQ